MRVSEALGFLKSQILEMDVNPQEAQWLLCSVLSCEQSDLIINSEKELTDSEQQTLKNHVIRRKRGEPLAYITGSTEFFGVEILVNSSVLIPRPETELLVEKVLEKTPFSKRNLVVDLGTGSGAIPLALLKNGFQRAMGLDASGEALEVASKNAEKLNLKNNIRFERVDLFNQKARMELIDSFSEGPQCITCNPPYIARDDIAVEGSVLDFEPHLALFADEQGLACYHHWLGDFVKVLSDDGLMVCEIGWDQGPSVKNIFSSFRCFQNIKILKDLSGRDRFVMGVK